MATATPSLTLRALLSQAAAKAGLDRPAPITAGLTPAAKALAAVTAARGKHRRDAARRPDGQGRRAAHGGCAVLLRGARRRVGRGRRSRHPSVPLAADRPVSRHDAALPGRGGPRAGAARGGDRQRAPGHRLGGGAAAARQLARPPAARVDRHQVGHRNRAARLADLLVDAGFTREDPVDEHGSFTIRGGIVDIFPAGDSEPVRIEFVGDMVESLRRFDPATQRSTGATDQVLVVPVRERFDDELGWMPVRRVPRRHPRREARSSPSVSRSKNRHARCATSSRRATATPPSAATSSRCHREAFVTLGRARARAGNCAAPRGAA